MRLSFARLCLLASVLMVMLFAGTADAQKKPKGTKPPKGGGSGSIELDEPAQPGAAAKPVDNSPPPVAGQMTELAAQAKRLFDGEKWQEAALALYRVYKGETGDDEGNKQLAQCHLAICL